MMFRTTSRPMTPLELHVGDKVKLLHSPARWWWTVQAVSENFVACVHQQPFEPAGVLCYTVLDWRNGWRGPCNLIGQSYGDGTYSPEECAEMLAEFEGPREIAGSSFASLEVSHRNNVRLEVLEVRRGR